MNVYKKIDWFYWAKRKSVSIMDAALLGCNINPKDRPHKLSDEVGNFYDLIDDNRDDCDYFSRNYKNAHPNIILSELASWCQSIDYPIPDELKALAKPKIKESVAININDKLIKKPLTELERRTYENIIVALLDCINGKLPQTARHQSFSSEAQMIESIEKHFKGYQGLTETTLKRKFSESRRKLQEEQ